MIAEPILINGKWTILIPRRNGTTYRAHSTDKQSIEDYRNELLEHARARARVRSK
ncbi:hypothetical protein HDR66_02860 [bacterium]|nr:hypothetical protein [bacterium]